MAKRFLIASYIFVGACVGPTGRVAAPPSAPLATPSAGGAASAASSEDDAGVPIASDDPIWGSRTAPVTIVEFADFQCPFCARAEPTLARIREAYGPNQVRIVWKNRPLPFHANARPAAEAGVGVQALAGNDAFWRFRELAFDKPQDFGEDAYVSWAQQAGVKDLDKFRSGLKSHVWGAKVDSDLSEAKELGAEGTPWFFVNGIRLIGAQPFEPFKMLIDTQIVAAQAKMSSGTPPDRVYAVLSKDNRAAQPPDDNDDDDGPADTKTVYKIPIGSSPSRGGAGALVTIVEFADYECPYCVRAEPTLRELRAQYGYKIRFVFKNEPLPFHKRAEPAAEAVLEVRAEKGDGAFWSMHDAMLESGADLSDDGLVAIAKGLGARADKVKLAIAKHVHKSEIEADADVADDFQANGTPHFFIDGRRLVGAQPKEAFAAIIDDELKKVQDLLDHGTKPENLYDTLTRDGQSAPQPERIEVSDLPANDPARGPSSAKVVIHEFADFQCPFCARAEATLKAITVAYANQVRVVWHDLPLSFHENALNAARAAREARTQRGDQAFWALHDTFFTDDTKLSRADLDDAARAMGLDMGKWSAALDGDAHKAEVSLDTDAADKLGFKGTPSFVIVASGSKSGYVIDGAQEYVRFRKIVDRALGETRR